MKNENRNEILCVTYTVEFQIGENAEFLHLLQIQMVKLNP